MKKHWMFAHGLSTHTHIHIVPQVCETFHNEMNLTASNRNAHGGKKRRLLHNSIF